MKAEAKVKVERIENAGIRPLPVAMICKFCILILQIEPQPQHAF